MVLALPRVVFIVAAWNTPCKTMETMRVPVEFAQELWIELPERSAARLV
jgi:hypothetical protein